MGARFLGGGDLESWRLPRRRRRPALRFAIAVGVVCATIGVTLMLFERSMIYYPTRYPDGFWDIEAVVAGTSATLESCFFSTADGVTLNAWWFQPAPAKGPAPTAAMVLLWFHGNAGNLSYRADMMLALGRVPVQVFIVDYRGYGRSDGSPSEEGLFRDGEAAWRYLTVARNVPAKRVVIFGKSLGGAVAADLASKVEPAGLVLQSSFTSVPDMAAHHFPFIPRALVRTRMDSRSKIGRVRCPVLVIHSPRDEIVPFALGRALFDAAPEPKRFVEVPGASHNDTWLVGGERYLDDLRLFLAECAG